MLEKITKWIMYVLVTIAATILAIMMFITVIDVAFRYIFNKPMLGAYELVEYIMAILAPFSIAYCAYEKDHVGVDFVMNRFSIKTQKIVRFATTIVAIAISLLITWQTILYIGQMYAFKLTSAVLLIPTYPFVFAVAMGIGVFAFVLIVQLIDSKIVKEN